MLGPRSKCWSTCRALRLDSVMPALGTSPVTVRTSCCSSRPPTCRAVSCWHSSVATIKGLSRQMPCRTNSCTCWKQLQAQSKTAGVPAGWLAVLPVCAGTAMLPVPPPWLLLLLCAARVMSWTLQIRKVSHNSSGYKSPDLSIACSSQNPNASIIVSTQHDAARKPGF
jgi:hypothetical protein